MIRYEFDGWVRVSKAEFIESFTKGDKVCVMPCKMRIIDGNPWCQPITPYFVIFDLEKDFYFKNNCQWYSDKKSASLFKKIVENRLNSWLNEVIWYNCDSQRGKYLAYYVYK